MDPSPEDVAEMLASASLGGPQNAVGFVMWRMTHRFQRLVEQALRPLDLTHLQYTLLALSARLGLKAPMPVQADLARFSGIHPMQVSAVLKALERKGLIRRVSASRAAKRVVITTAGLDALREAFPRVQAVQHKLFGGEGLPGGPLLDILLAIEKRHDGKDDVRG